MKNLFTILATIMCISCSNNNDNDKVPGQGIDAGASIDIYLKNSQGNNIFDTDKYPENSISIRYLIGGKEFGYGYDAPDAFFLDAPKGFFIVNLSGNETGKGMSVFLNHDSSEEYPITYIHWNATDTDTIKAQYRRPGNSVILEKFWLFENNTWKEKNSGELTIIK